MNTNPRKAGVVGWPVKHSRSPQVFRHWFQRYGIDGEYRRHATPPDEFEACIRDLQAAGFRGCNVTIPHKEKAFALSDERSGTANRIGSVNTLVFRADGGIEGDSTDGYGFMEALRAGVHGVLPMNRPAVVLGAGGAARAVADSLVDAGIPEVRIVNRTLERAEGLVQDIPGPLFAFASGDAGDALSDVGILVNATSLGMEDGPPLFVDSVAAPPDAVVMDLVYAPLQTALLASARACGQCAVDGLGMLLHQARPGFRRWFGIDPEVDDSLRLAALEAPVS